MAQSDLTDEEKAAAVLGNVDPVKEDEPTEPASPTEPENEEPEEPESTEEEKPEEEEQPEPDSTFTKQFPNLKGETLAEYVPELEKAYDNSFKEALRLNQVIKDNDALVAKAREIIDQANTAVSQNPANPAPAISQDPLAQSPELEWIRGQRRQTMQVAFEEFKKDYPQVLDEAEFGRFLKAVDGIKVGLTAAMGREPTDLELFQRTAGTFGWQAATQQDRKDSVIKENASASRSGGGQSPTAPRGPRVSDAQVDAYLKMFTSKTREEAVKELSEVV